MSKDEVYLYLCDKAEYALNSRSIELMYEAYGAAKMARKLSAITQEQFIALNKSSSGTASTIRGATTIRRWTMSNINMAFWGVIPAPVRGDQTLTDKAKLLYADLSALADEKGYCWASNEYLAQLYKCGERTISRCISQLADLGFIRVEIVPSKGSKGNVERRIFLGIFGIDKIGSTANFGETGIDKNGETTLYCNSFRITGMNRSNDNTPHKPPCKKTGATWLPERFEKFWQFYPSGGSGKGSKRQAARAWDKLKPDEALLAEIGRALEKQMATEMWSRGVGIPYASTYLNGRRWEEAAEIRAPQRSVGAPTRQEAWGWQ